MELYALIEASLIPLGYITLEQNINELITAWRSLGTNSAVYL